VGTSIGIGFLRQRPDIARFLSHHVRFAEQLGRSSQSERSFLGSTAGYQGSFRQTVRRLRGGQTSSTRRGPQTGGLRSTQQARTPTVGSAPINRTLGQVFPSTRGTSASGKYIGVETASFLGRNPALGELIKTDPELRRGLARDIADGEISFETVIANAASRRLGASSPIDREFLSTHTDQALFIALNIGGIADILRRDDDLARTFTMSARAAGEYAVNRRTAVKAAALFDEGSKITQDLLEKNPRTAMYLLMNPDRASSLNQNRKEAAKFVSKIAAFETGLEQTIADKAVSVMSHRAVFHAEFMEQNPRFAEFVVGDYLTSPGESLAAFLNNNIASTSANPNVGQIIAQRQARVAAHRLPGGFPLDEAFFQDNPGITALVNASDTFAIALVAEQPTIQRFIESVNGGGTRYNGNVRRAIRAFEAGYVSRPGIALDLTA